MGLFDRFKKQSEKENTQAGEVVTKEKVQEAQAEEKAGKTETAGEEMNASKRFTLMVEDSFLLKDDKGVVVVGNLHGSLCKGDVVYVIQPNGAITRSFVEAMEIGPGKVAEQAENEKVAIQLKDIKSKDQLPKFTVLTGIKPQTVVETDVDTENPQLLGLSMEYKEYYKDNQYMNLLIFVMVHAHYVVPVNAESLNGEKLENGADLKRNAKLHFPSLKNPIEQDRSVFPAFTDGTALANWKNLFSEKYPKQTVLLTFQEILPICRGTGIVINPFGPIPIPLMPEQIQQIVNLEGYQKEFGEGQQDALKKMPIDPEGKLLIGVPKENEEIKLLKEAIIRYAESVEEIRRVDFLLKMDTQKQRAYLCVVDCPEQDAEKIFASIHAAASPYMNEVKKMEFLLNGKSKLANDVVNEKSCIYEA